MEKKILIATVALSLVAVAIIMIASTNRQDSTNEDSTFVGKIQNDTATIPTQSIAPQTDGSVQDIASESVDINTKSITEMSQDKQLANDINATQNTEIIVTEESIEPKATINNQTSLTDIIEVSNSENTSEDTVNLAATKPPLESLLFKSGDDNLPVPTVPNIQAKEEKTDLSTNKFDEIQNTVMAVETPKIEDSKADEPKVETSQAVTEQAQTPEIVKTEAAKTEPAKTEAVKAESEKAKVLVTSTKLKANGQDPTIVAAKLEMNGDVVSLRLEGNQALSAKTYILNNPERVVFDLSGKWEISVPRVISNRMVKSIRLGEQASGTRIVFDMLVPAKKSDVEKVDANTLELNIR